MGAVPSPSHPMGPSIGAIIMTSQGLQIALQKTDQFTLASRDTVHG